MARKIGSLNKRIKREDMVCYKNYSGFAGMTKKEEKEYLNFNDVGYRYKVLEVSDKLIKVA